MLSSPAPQPCCRSPRARGRNAGQYSGATRALFRKPMVAVHPGVGAIMRPWLPEYFATITDLTVLLRACVLYLGNNSAPKHIAAALGVPTIGIHAGIVDATEWAPIGPRAIALQRHMACSPCYLVKAGGLRARHSVPKETGVGRSAPILRDDAGAGGPVGSCQGCSGAGGRNIATTRKNA
jgi:hypothetical protein